VRQTEIIIGERRLVAEERKRRGVGGHKKDEGKREARRSD